MNRLLSIIKSKYVFMGEKDFQQYILIKRILGKKYNIKIIGCPTIIEKSKIALSTRNKLLDKKNYIKASLIAKYLIKLKKKTNLNNKNQYFLMKKNIKNLENNYQIKIDYLEFRNEKDLKISNSKKKSRLFVAYNIGYLRLIDNF